MNGGSTLTSIDMHHGKIINLHSSIYQKIVLCILHFLIFPVLKFILNTPSPRKNFSKERRSRDAISKQHTNPSPHACMHVNVDVDVSVSMHAA